jgi:FlaA1/EpsC-like NDP-sugar epimerase
MKSSPRNPLLERLRRHWLSAGTQTILDLGVLSAAFIVAYLLRFDFQVPRNFWHSMLVQGPFVVLLQFVLLTLVGGRNFIWRYAGMAHIKAFVYAALGSFAVTSLMRLLIPDSHHTWRVPLSISFVNSILAFGGAFGLRVFRRAVYENRKRRGLVRGNRSSKRQSVLLIGAGQAGVLAANEINSRDLNLDIKGFIDDDPHKLGRMVVRNHRVVGTTFDLPRLANTLGIDHVVITISAASRQDIKRIVKICEDIPIKVRIIAGLYEMIEGHVQINPIRDVQIEDLLGREPVSLDIDSISKELAGKVVMVTGAGGSIGSELARQVIRFSPSQLLLVERAEFALFHIDRELRASDPDNCLVPLVADVGDAPKMRRIFEIYSPHVVIHAAAHKHVPLMEFNPTEAIKNNVLNSSLLCELADEFKVEAFVLISTDKAVNPTSVMGASKRMAELVVQSFARRSQTRFVAVRFGNVIGSNGSAVPIFQEQIRKGGPLTITDKRMRRYFMTIPEAAQLVLQASTIGEGGEVFLLHMGEPVRIIDLAEALIALSGLKPYQDIDIVEIGMRPGEKLYEELTFESEGASSTSHPKIFISKIQPTDESVVHASIERLTALASGGDEQAIREYLGEVLPEANLNIPRNGKGVNVLAASTTI